MSGFQHLWIYNCKRVNLLSYDIFQCLQRLYFWDRFTLYSLGWPRTHDPRVSVCWVLRLYVHTTSLETFYLSQLEKVLLLSGDWRGIGVYYRSFLLSTGQVQVSSLAQGWGTICRSMMSCRTALLWEQVVWQQVILRQQLMWPWGKPACRNWTRDLITMEWFWVIFTTSREELKYLQCFFFQESKTKKRDFF